MFRGLSEIIQQGGWGFAALVMVGIGYQYIFHRREMKTREDAHEENIKRILAEHAEERRTMMETYRAEHAEYEARISSLLDGRYNDMQVNMKETIAALTAARESMVRVADELRKFQDSAQSARDELTRISAIVSKCEGH